MASIRAIPAMSTVLESIATANPPLRVSQADGAAFLSRVEGYSPSLRRRIPQVFALSGIEHRHTCIKDYARSAPEFQFYPPTWSLDPKPGTAARNALYKEAILPIAEEAARGALEQSGRDPSEITHVIAVTCTGFFAPGLDIHLVRRLCLPATTARSVIGFMGCYAAFNGLKLAHAICQSQPDARVLLVCAELCSLHFQIENTLESVVVNALFADGAAAVVLASTPASETAGKLVYKDGYCMMDEASMDAMTWEVGDTGYMMGLSPQVPEIIARNLPKYMGNLLGRNALEQNDVNFWAVHPGGRQVLDRTQSVLGLTDEQMADSYGVLRDYGNMSSPTILFILKRILERNRQMRAEGKADYGPGVALAFGPGLTIEGAVFDTA